MNASSPAPGFWFGLAALDIAVITAYLVGIAAVGIYVARKVKDTGHYFLGGRGFGKLLMMGQSFGVGTHAEQPVAVAGASYQHGISGIWYQWKFIFCTPFYWLIAPIFRRLRRTTTAEVYEDRYGSAAALIFTVYALVFFMVNQGAMLRGAATVFTAATGGAVQPTPAIIGMTVVFLVYSYLGGLVSAAVTDFIQSFFIIVMSVILIPLGLRRIGGDAALHETLAPGMFDLWQSAEINLFFIAMLSVSSLIGIFTQPHHMASIGTGKTEANCRVGFTYGNFVKRLCTIGWAFLGLIVAVMVPGIPETKREEVFGVACRDLLPAGGLGLMISCVLAANMSTCSAFMVDTGALFTQNIYRRYLRPEAPDAHYLFVGRVAGAAITLGAIGVSFAIPLVLDAILFSENLAAFMGISFVAAIVWPRASRGGMILSFLTALGVYYGMAYARTMEKFGAFNFRGFVKWDAELSLYAMSAGAVMMVAGSLLTRPEPKEKLDDFYRRLRTPALGDGAPEDDPAAAEAALSRGHALVLVDLLRGGWARYRADLLGFAAAWGVVAALIGLTLWAVS
jgi:Na+/proline symporter